LKGVGEHRTEKLVYTGAVFVSHIQSTSTPI
jgi:hypothetical protein